MRESYYLFAYFRYSHLPEHLHKYSKPFHDLAEELDKQWASLSERDYKQASKRRELEAAMRKLLEAKDCAVRAQV